MPSGVHTTAIGYADNRGAKEVASSRCYLNRKPYRDKRGTMRQRLYCDGSCPSYATSKKGCKLIRQPIGAVMFPHN